MSRLRLNVVADPSPPATDKVELFYDSAGPGAAAPRSVSVIDQNGVIARLAGFTILDYRLVGIRVLTSATSYVPTNGTRAIYVECVGGGGQGGGAATSSSTASLGTGGGGGGYSAKWLTGAQVKNPTTYAIGAGGSTGGAGAAGQAGGNTTWDTNVIIANGGLGGLVMAAGTTNIAIVPPAVAAAGTGDVAVAGSLAGFGYRLSGTVLGWSGVGGGGPFQGGGAGNMVITTTTNGGAAAAGAYGAGGGGAATLSTAATGGVGIGGLVRVWEFA
jgi:hypothetical protein